MKARWQVLIGIATACVALLALSGIAAARVCPGRSVSINGQGASLQRLAQERVWIPGFNSSECREVTITYSATGSGGGLSSWRADTGTGRSQEGPEDEFIATDDAPTSTQIANMKRAGNETEVTVIPVAQAAVSVIIRPPANCTISQIDNENLERIFRGATTVWTGLGTGAGCAGAAITPIVRQDISGTTFQFKHYLWLINSAAINIGGVNRTWLELQIGAENTRWPQAWGNGGAAGGTSLITRVNATVGSIGYANVADVNLGTFTNIRILEVLNGPSGEGTYAHPLSGNDANCSRTTYRDELGRGDAITPELRTLYFEIYGSNPRIAIEAGGEARAYSLCTLTWVVLYLDYEAAGWSDEVSLIVALYVLYILNGGQTAIAGNKYRALPSAFPSPLLAIVRRILEVRLI